MLQWELCGCRPTGVGVAQQAEVLATEREAQAARKGGIEDGDVELGVMAHAATVEIGGADGRPLVVYDAYFGVDVDRTVGHGVACAVLAGCRQGEGVDASGLCRFWRVVAQPG